MEFPGENSPFFLCISHMPCLKVWNNFRVWQPVKIVGLFPPIPLVQFCVRISINQSDSKHIIQRGKQETRIHKQETRNQKQETSPELSGPETVTLFPNKPYKL
jgi:hypothetical protein